MEILSIKIRDNNDTASRRGGSVPSLIQGLRHFDREEQQKWFEQNWTISLYVVAAYLIFIYYGTEFMKNRKPFELKRVMTIWNISLALFSILACVSILPEFFALFSNSTGFYKSVCANITEVSEVGLFWGWLFTLSKVAELGDTVFLILRKRQLIFLHWYHHTTVLLYCWFSYSDQISPARWFICVNYSVHAMMYSYYALRSLGIKIPRWIAMSITTLQLSQMVIGVIVNVYAYQMKQQSVDCEVTTYHLHLGLGMYASYFLLFSHYFHNAYLHKGGLRRNDNNNNSNNYKSKVKVLKVN